MWGELLRKKSSGKNYETVNKKKRQENIKRGVDQFLDDPSEENFKNFWSKLYAAKRSANWEHVFSSNSIDTLENVFSEMSSSTQFDAKWESQVKYAKKVLWELFGYLHLDDEKPIPPMNTCTQNALEFFGMPISEDYKDVFSKLKIFRDNFYLKEVGQATKGTDHEIPVFLEIDQLFNVVDKLTEEDIKEAEIKEEAELYKRIFSKKRNYFWVTANPDIWTVDDLESKGSIFYAAYDENGAAKKIHDAFETAKPGDRVIFYESSPTKYTKAIGKVEKGLHKEEEEGYKEPVEGITISFERNMSQIDWSTLSNDPEIEGSKPISLNAQGSLFKLTEEEFNHLLSLENGQPEVEVEEKQKIPTVKFGIELEINELYFPNQVTTRLKSQISAAIENGKYIILIGPPGTGKSKLAKEICSSYVEDNYQMVTANSDWSTFDTIGGYHPEEEGSLKFEPGIFLECFKDKITNEPKNKWLILDEINRADIDKAFGALFSALTGDKINLSFKADNDKSIVVRPQEDGEETIKPTDHEHIIPKDWRLIATMNTYDKTSLYEMSYAFMRRFAFIPVPAPKEEAINHHLVEKYLDIWGIDDRKFSKPVADLWGVINRFRKVGPATIEDIYKTLLKMTNGALNTNLDYSSALIMHVLPQFEGLLEEDITDFIENLNKLSSDVQDFGEDDVYEISDFASEYFQINREKLPTPAKEKKSE